MREREVFSTNGALKLRYPPQKDEFWPFPQTEITSEWIDPNSRAKMIKPWYKPRKNFLDLMIGKSFLRQKRQGP